MMNSSKKNQTPGAFQLGSFVQKLATHDKLTHDNATGNWLKRIVEFLCGRVRSNYSLRETRSVRQYIVLR